jgi:hypothetical protein
VTVRGAPLGSRRDPARRAQVAAMVQGRTRREVVDRIKEVKAMLARAAPAT